MLHTPVWAGIAVAVLSALPFLVSTAIGVIITGATGLIDLSYFLNNIASLNALLYGGLMLINFLWFGGLRNTYTNPALNLVFTSWAGVPVLNVLGNIPIFEFSLLVGAIYWFGFKRRAVLVYEKASQADAAT